MNIRGEKWQSLNHTLFFYGLSLLLFSIPLHKAFFSPFVILLALIWVLDFNFKEKWNSFKKNRVWLFGAFSFLFYLLHAISVLYSENKTAAYFDLEVKMMFWIAPILLLTVYGKYYTLSSLYKLFLAFISGCLLSMAIALGKSFCSFIDTGNLSAFYYIHVSPFHHPSYMAMYLVFSLFLVVFMLYVKPVFTPKWLKIPLGIYSLPAVAYILLLQSKAGYLSLVLLFIFVLSYSFSQKKKGIVIVSVSLLLLGILTLCLFPGMRDRLQEVKTVFTRVFENKTGYPTSTASRIDIWDNAITLVEKAPLFGYGAGDVQTQLNNSYKQYDMTPALEQRLNPHNQFMQTAIAIGVLGLCILLLLIFYPLYYNRKSPLYLLTLFFSLLIFCNILVESMLEVQAGISFFTVFVCLLVKYGQTGESKEERIEIKI